MTRVLFLCTGNSCRSQMAEGILRYLGKKDYLALSAGTKPSVVNPYAIQAMAEMGIDIMSQRSKSVEEYKGWTIDHVITVCDNARQVCPHFPSKTQVAHWHIEDPAEFQGEEEARMNIFRRARDELLDKICDCFNLDKGGLPKPVVK